MRQGIKKVLFIEPVVAHYRSDTFSFLLASKHFESFILAGKDYEGVKDVTFSKSFVREYLTFRILNFNLYHLKGSLKFIRNFKPDLIICSGIDFRHFYTILIFLWSRFTKTKFCWWSHGGFGNQGRFGKYLRGIIYRSSTHIFVYSEQGKKNLITLGVEHNKITVVGNAINSKDLGFNKALYLKDKDNSKIVLLYSGRLTSAKRLDVLLRALKELKVRSNRKYYCTIVGDGIIDELTKLAKELCISELVEFTGGKYGDDVVPYFQLADLFVYPSGIGLSILHALSYGLPVITTDNKKLHYPEFELLKPGINGDLFIDNNPIDLSNKIEEWSAKLKNNKDMFYRVCINSINEKGYLSEVQAGKIESVINQLI